MTSVKRSVFRRPVLLALGAGALGALLVINLIAVYRGMDSPWLFAAAIVADMVAVGLGVLVAAREVSLADNRSEASEARLESIIDSAMDAIITIDAAQKIIFFNSAAETMFKCPRWQAIGGPLDRFLPERFRAGHRVHIEKFGKTGVTSRRMGEAPALRGLRADGEEFPIEASISQSGQAGERYFTVILRDITRRQQAEEVLLAQQNELRELSARVLEAREEEKTHIARELHDELGQLLTALKMDLASMREKLVDADQLQRAQEMGALLDRTVTATRRISADLRPLMLDDLGLADAAGWLAQDFAKRSGIACDARIAPPEALQDVAKTVATAVYRALQESLTNIGRHAGARSAWVVLEAREDMLYLEVEDDGSGIAPRDLVKSRSLGLKGMRERFTYLGGALEIGTAARGGTRLRIQVPKQGKAGESAA